MITITKKLDMSPHGIPQVIHVSQYDSDFSIQFKLYASVGTLSIESGTTAEIRGTKGSGTGYSASATLNTSNGTVTVAGSEQMTAVAGRNTFEIVLKKSGKVLGSANFILLVERAALDADTITDASVLRELEAIVEGAETATQAAEEAEDAADRAEAAAQTLVIDPTLTLPGQPADAKMVGDKITDLTETVDNFEGISDDVKVALLDIVSHIALWTDGQGQDYYDALENALYANVYPDLRTGEVKNGYYLSATGEVVQSGALDYYNEKYFPINPNKKYFWVRGFCGFFRKENNVYKRAAFGFRICYYDADKVFISRENNVPPTELGVAAPRYYELTPPNNAAFIRVSWPFLPVGNIYRKVPNDLYAVFLVLANLDDSNIGANTDLMSKVTYIRDGAGVLQDVVYGRSDINTPSYNGSIASNNSANSISYSASVWFRDVFNVSVGYSPETAGIHGPNTDTLTRIQNFSSFLMKKGDIIRFNGVKAHVYAERISDGYVQHTTAWITDNSDFVIGGE